MSGRPSRVRLSPAEPRSLYWKAPKYSAVRYGHWKLVLRNDGTEAELYDLASDPYETRDLARRDRQRMSDLWQRWLKLSARDRNR